MSKNNKKSNNNQVGKQEELTNEIYDKIVQQGEALGAAFMSMLSIVTDTIEGYGAATFALAKAWGSIQAVAEVEGVEVNKLFDELNMSFKERYVQILKENEEEWLS